MSDSIGLIAISFLGVTGLWVSLWVARLTNEMGLQVCTGVVNGTTVPPVQRWQMLYTMWVPYQTGGFVVTMFIGVAELLMASLVGNQNIKFLAYLAVIVASVGCLSWALMGGSNFINYRSVLRQAEPD
jgi:hypothetical protein